MTNCSHDFRTDRDRCSKCGQPDFKDHRHYAIPVKYAEKYPPGVMPKPISRRLHRPRRCHSHRYKAGAKLMYRIFVKDRTPPEFTLAS